MALEFVSCNAVPRVASSWRIGIEWKFALAVVWWLLSKTYDPLIKQRLLIELGIEKVAATHSSSVCASHDALTSSLSRSHQTAPDGCAGIRLSSRVHKQCGSHALTR